MSNAIHDAIAHRKGNSLCPESCVLSPGAESLIHAFRLTSANPAPVDNATAATHSDRLVWMALRAIGGGW